MLKCKNSNTCTQTQDRRKCHCKWLKMQPWGLTHRHTQTHTCRSLLMLGLIEKSSGEMSRLMICSLLIQLSSLFRRTIISHYLELDCLSEITRGCLCLHVAWMGCRQSTYIMPNGHWVIHLAFAFTVYQYLSICCSVYNTVTHQIQF